MDRDAASLLDAINEAPAAPADAGADLPMADGSAAQDAGLEDAATMASPDVAPPTPDAAMPVADVESPPDLAPTDASGPPDVAPDMTRDLAAEVKQMEPICPADPDLVLCVPFESEIKDRSPHQHATLMATGVPFVNGAKPADGKAGAFGSASRVQFGYSSAMDVTALTIEATVTPNQVPASGRMGILDYTREYSFFLLPMGKLRCIVVTQDSVETIDSPAAVVQAQAASHVACTVAGQTIALWKNGLQVTSKSLQGKLKTGGGDDTMVIGGNFDTSQTDPFDGVIDNVRVWRTARTGSGCGGALTCP